MQIHPGSSPTPLRKQAMKKALVILILAFSLLLPCHHHATADSPAWSVYFSPKGGCTKAIVNELDSAKKTILVQAYSFTSAPIAKALRDAHKRVVRVEVVLDKSNKTAKYSSADFLLNASIPTLIDSAHAIGHNKVMVIDDEIVITGSFNFTKAAEDNNAENLLILRDKALAEKYTANWRLHSAHSEVYQGRGK
jgi:phosphatidylserine/phosphatidylglycerophosphate/cardiolipin synthase-like enzyme